MWPWEHAAIGYIAYSIYCRRRGQPPEDGPTLALLFGTQFPDLVDKPLAWGFGVLPAGRSLAHSLVVAIPLTFAIWVICRRYRREEYAVAFAIGYLLHLPADAITPALYGNQLHPEFLLWPLVPIEGPEGPGFDLGQALAFFATPHGVVFILGELALLGWAFYRWRGDGYPAIGTLPTREKLGDEAEPDDQQAVSKSGE